jgi:hypothetical protein
MFHISCATRLLDVGGDLFFWDLADEMGLPVPQITIVNIYRCEHKCPSNIEWVVADGTNLPFANRSFDIVFSNSVIEHLGSSPAQVKMAQEIRRISPQYFVQTPNRQFPVEPHFLTPFVHWLPLRLQRKILRNFTVRGLITRPTQMDCDKMLDELCLLGTEEVRELFPASEIVIERFCGIPKSIIAIQR